MTTTTTLSSSALQQAQSVSANRRRLVMALILIPVFIGALDLTIISATLPEILTRLGIAIDTNLGLAAWAVTGYLLAYTVSMILMGRISDLVGRRSVYLICLGIFILGSLWVATAHEWPTEALNLIARQFLGQRPDTTYLTLLAIIIGRVIQALGAGAIVPVSIALVADLYPPESRAQPVGIIGAVDTLGWVLGHLYGGVMVNFFQLNGENIATFFRQIGLNWPAPDWHTLFYLNVPIGIIAFILTWWVLHRVEHPIGKGRFDFVGAILVSLALISLNIGLGGSTEISGSTTLGALDSQANATPFNPILLMGAGACLLIFLAWEWRQQDPLLDLHLFRKRNVSAAAITNLLVGFCLMLALVSVPLLVNLRAKDTSSQSIATAAAQSGLLLSGLTVPMALAAIPGGWLTTQIGNRLTILIGLGLSLVGFLIAGLTWRGDTPDLVMASHMVLTGIGLGLTISPIGTAVINDAGESQRGVASALVIILRLVGMTLAAASLTTIALNRALYLAALARDQFPLGLTAQQIQDASLKAYYHAGIQVVDEILIFGAIVCLLALIPPLFLRTRARINHNR